MSFDEPRAKSTRLDNFRQWLAVVLMPMIVALTGGFISLAINHTNERDTERLETASREIRVMELLFGQLTDPDEKTRARGVRSFNLFLLFVPSLKAHREEILQGIGGQPGQTTVTNAVIDQLGGLQKTIDRLPEDTKEGTALYYRGEFFRRNNKKEAVKYFRRYLENEETRYRQGVIPSAGYFDERTAWVALLLAYDDGYLAEREPDRTAEASLLDDACFALKRSAERRPEGFVKPTSVTSDDTRRQVEMLRKTAKMPACPG